jgi:hypothetical protein
LIPAEPCGHSPMQLMRCWNCARTNSLVCPALYCFLLMRRSIALALTVIFSLTLIAPVFGPGADANLPACCRRNGKHHCMMRGLGWPEGYRKGFTSVSEKCPCPPATTCAVHSQVFNLEAGKPFHALSGRHPASTPRTDALRNMTFLLSHPKRGPPSPLA